LTQTVDRTAAAIGEQLALSLSVSLRNPAATSGASHLVLTDALPASLEPVSVRTNRGSCVQAQAVVCNLDFIAGDLVARVLIVARVTGSGEIVNSAAVRADETDPDLSNNSATVRLNTPATVPTVPLAPPVPRKPTVVRGVTKVGSVRADLLRGSRFADRLNGRGGNDRLYGYVGNDRLLGGPGDDLLVGGLGNDLLDAGAGNDTIEARDGQKDTILCGPGTDTVKADKTDALTGCEKVTRR
jgi:uncharacterized repeat protein (TIGR01451 family)